MVTLYQTDRVTLAKAYLLQKAIGDQRLVRHRFLSARATEYIMPLCFVVVVPFYERIPPSPYLDHMGSQLQRMESIYYHPSNFGLRMLSLSSSLSFPSVSSTIEVVTHQSAAPI